MRVENAWKQKVFKLYTVYERQIFFQGCLIFPKSIFEILVIHKYMCSILFITSGILIFLR